MSELATEVRHGGRAIRRVGDVVYEIAPEGAMRVPVRILADETLLAAITRDRSLEQLVNVSALPGIAEVAVGMPDMHEGYGFPVGGVAATRLPHGVISPGGIGFDINCGVRLLATDLLERDVVPHAKRLVHELARSIPTGYGRHGRLELDERTLDRVLEEGCPYLVRHHGFGIERDLEHLESGGRLAGADASCVSTRAKARGRDQLGTLGGGNHFLELQRVEAIYDDELARALGLALGRVTVLLHTGSRGLGHQVCSDSVHAMEPVMAEHGIVVADRQLACAPLSSSAGKRYFAAMAAAANFAWCNRQVLTMRVRDAFARVLGASEGIRIVYDVAHNIAKIERDGEDLVCVHRKGATRAFGPSSEDLPATYRGVGQPVFIPGSMGTASFVLVGSDDARAISLASACHGAGRAASRTAAKREVDGHELRKSLEARGIVVECPSNAELAEEAPSAYKDVERVVDVVARAGIARKVARLVPFGVLKG